MLDTRGNTSLQPAETLEAFGVKIGIRPTAVPMAVISGVRKLLADIRQTGSLENNSLDLASFEDYNNVLGLAEIKSLETRYKT